MRGRRRDATVTHGPPLSLKNLQTHTRCTYKIATARQQCLSWSTLNNRNAWSGMTCNEESATCLSSMLLQGRSVPRRIHSLIENEQHLPANTTREDNRQQSEWTRAKATSSSRTSQFVHCLATYSGGTIALTSPGGTTQFSSNAASGSHAMCITSQIQTHSVLSLLAACRTRDKSDTFVYVMRSVVRWLSKMHGSSTAPGQTTYNFTLGLHVEPMQKQRIEV